MILISVFHLFIAEIFLVFFSLSQILTIFPSNNPRLVININNNSFYMESQRHQNLHLSEYENVAT